MLIEARDIAGCEQPAPASQSLVLKPTVGFESAYQGSDRDEDH
jgi:hypothetical protein